MQFKIIEILFWRNGLGRRIEKYDAIADESVYYYYNAQWQVLAEHSGGSFTNQYLYGNYIDETLLMRNGTDDYYYAHNHLFSPVALMDDSGTVVERYEYNAYGKVAVSIDSDNDGVWFDSLGSWDSGDTIYAASQNANPYTFTGRRLDILDSGDLSLMYYRARTYDTYTGRFLQHDPLGIDPSEFHGGLFEALDQYNDGLCLYQYASGMPIISADPLGLWTNTRTITGIFEAEIENPNTGASVTRHMEYWVDVPYGCKGENELNAWIGGPVIMYKNFGIGPDSWCWPTPLGFAWCYSHTLDVTTSGTTAKICPPPSKGTIASTTVTIEWNQKKGWWWMGIELSSEIIPLESTSVDIEANCCNCFL